MKLATQGDHIAFEGLRLFCRANHAAELSMTGRTLLAEEAKMWNVVTDIVEDVQLVDRCIELANSMLRLSPQGLVLTKMQLNRSSLQDLRTCIDREDQTQVQMLNTKESLAWASGANPMSPFHGVKKKFSVDQKAATKSKL